MRNNIIIGFSKEILKKYKEINKNFYIKINKTKKVYIKLQ